MKERLAHKVEIKELDIALQTACKQAELFGCEAAFWPACLGAEAAAEVADVGYFEIAAGEHVGYGCVVCVWSKGSENNWFPIIFLVRAILSLSTYGAGFFAVLERGTAVSALPTPFAAACYNFCGRSSWEVVFCL